MCLEKFSKSLVLAARLRQMERGKLKIHSERKCSGSYISNLGARRTMAAPSISTTVRASFINFSNLNFCQLNVHNRRRTYTH